MATWVTVRNTLMATATGCALQLSFLDYYLPLAGWTRIGCGTGTAGTFNWGATKIFPTYPTITGIANLAWAIWQNASGVQFMYKVNDLSSGYAVNRYSPYGLYSSSGISATVPPAETLDEVTFNASYGYNFGTAGYFSFAYTTDGDSWIMFGKRGSSDDICAHCLKLEGAAPADTKPFHFAQSCNAGSSIWARYWRTGNYDNQGRMLLPIGASPPYSGRYGQLVDAFFSEPLVKGTSAGEAFMDTIGVDPVTGNHQLFPVWSISCWGSSYPSNVYVRGRTPGIMRAPTVLNTGDRLGLSGGLYTWMVIGDYVVPWGSSDSLSVV